MCIQRLLGREAYSEQEKIAWSIVIATKGLPGFIDALLNSQEYLENFGYDTVSFNDDAFFLNRLMVSYLLRGCHAMVPIIVNN